MWETYLFAVVEFLSTPSARRATAEQAAKTAAEMISIHALREEGDDPRHRRRHHDQNFYPRPPRGGRPTNQTAGATSPGFLSTPSARRATKAASMPRNNFRFLSTPSARRATLRRERLTDFLMISIHALREEGDLLFR